MQRIIFRQDSKQLNRVNNISVFSGEKDVDFLEFLIPLEYNGVDLSDCNVRMSYVTGNGFEHSFLIDEYKKEELYENEYFIYLVPVSPRFTSVEGTVNAYLSITKTVDGEEQKILKTGDVEILIRDHLSDSSQLDEEDIEIIDQVVLKAQWAVDEVERIEHIVDDKVDKSTTVAGISLENDIDADDLAGNVLTVYATRSVENRDFYTKNEVDNALDDKLDKDKLGRGLRINGSNLESTAMMYVTGDVVPENGQFTIPSAISTIARVGDIYYCTTNQRAYLITTVGSYNLAYVEPFNDIVFKNSDPITESGNSNPINKILKPGVIYVNTSTNKMWMCKTKTYDNPYYYYTWISMSTKQIIESENNPPTSGATYKIGDEWIKSGSQVFMLVKISGNHPPFDYTWKDLTEQVDLTAGNGIDIDNNVVNVDLSNANDILKFTVDNQKQLWADGNAIANDSAFKATMPFIDEIRQNLTSGNNYPLASKQYVDGLMSGALKRLIVDQLPTQDIDTNTIYMVLRSAPTTNNIYDEYLYVKISDDPETYDWELIGNTEVDLSNYYTKNEVYNKTEIDTNEPNIFTGEGKPANTKENYPNVKVGDIYIDLYAYSASNISNRIWICVQVGRTSSIFIPSQLNLFIGTTPYANKTAFANATNRSIIDLGSLFIDKTHGDVYKLSSINNEDLTWTKLATVADLTNYYTKSETDSLLGNKQDSITVSGHITKSGNNIDTEANKVYPAIYINGVLSKQTSDYPNIKKNDLIVESEIMNNPLTSAKIARVKFDPSTTIEIEALSNIVVIDDVPPLEQYGSSGVYTVDQIVVSKNGNFYRCATAVRDNDNLYTYTWQTYSSSTYTSGNGISISNNEISVDLKDGESVLGFSNGKLKSDLSAYYTKTETDNKLTEKQNTISGGNGIDVSSDVVSVDIYDDTIQYLSFNNSQLYLDTSALGTSGYLRNRLASTSYPNALASKDYVDTQTASLGSYISATIDNQTYVMTLRLGHGQNILSTATVDLPLESVVVSGSYDSQTKEVVLTLQSGSTIRFSVADLVSGLQSEITSQNPLSADLVNDSNTTNKFVPTHSSTESGKVLGVDSNGDLEWTTKGGGSYSGGDGIDITNDTISVDIASGSALQITSGELDVDLSSKQDVIDSTHKLDADYVNDSNSTNKFTTSAQQTSWTNKQDTTTITTDTSSTTPTLTLADNNEYRYTTDLTSLTLTMPNGDFIASVVFSSGSTPTSMTYDSSIKWSGDDVTSNAFVPVASKTYNIVFWYDGININAISRSA